MLLVIYEYFTLPNTNYFQIDDDGSALRVGANYKSFTDLEGALIKFQQDILRPTL